jgi:hypothetical protein
MIAFVRGELCEPAHTGRPVSVRIGDDEIRATVPTDPGPVAAHDTVLVARSRVDVGITTREHVVLLGRWDAGRVPGPGGLEGSPAVVLPDRSTVDLVLAGLHRAGRDPAVVVEEAGEPAIGQRMLDAVAAGAEVLVIDGGAGPELLLARVLGGLPLVALPLDDPEQIRAVFAGLDADVQVPVPTGDDAQRAAVRTLLEPLALETIHHLVEVDPRPALGELTADPAGASLAALAAVAAGVLAGRIVVGNRRWRAEAEA